MCLAPSRYGYGGVWRPEPHLYPRSANNVPPALEMCLVVVVVQRTALLLYLCFATKLLRAC